MSNAPQDPANALRALMNEAQQTEVACQQYLEHAHPILAPPLSRVVEVIREQPSLTGRSDYFMLCEVYEFRPRRRIVLWEAKAPQLAPFKFATRNRLIPSRALIEAENQLLHYFDEYRSSGHFRDRHGIGHADDVKLGGVIIGRDNNLIQSTTEHTISADEMAHLASSALRIRNEYFYQDRIRVITWDRVAHAIEHNTGPARAPG